MMSTTDLATQRLLNQQLTTSACTSATQVVQWMGAMQAQDYDMAKWAIGVRWPGSTESLVEEAIDKGDIIRTHILRPTWHFVAASDIHWLLELTAPHVRKLLVSMNRKLELDETIFQKSNAVIEQALTGNTYLTREELMHHLQEAGIKTNELRSSHLMFQAELSGLVCNGPRRSLPNRAKQFTYALLHERVPAHQSFSRDEALAELAKRYFTSHGPATLKDFSWWSGLTATDTKKAIDLAKTHLQSTISNGQLYWLPPSIAAVQPLPEQIHFLPAYDEFMVSYCDRTASLPPEFARQTNTGNGIFNPVIAVNGQVVGLWKRTVKPKGMTVHLTFFRTLSADLIERIREQANQYANYAQNNLLAVV